MKTAQTLTPKVDNVPARKEKAQDVKFQYAIYHAGVALKRRGFTGCGKTLAGAGISVRARL
jgi:hypothetical protein